MSEIKSTKAIILKTHPEGKVNLDLSSADATFSVEEHELKPLNDNELLIKVLYLSNDPTQRTWIQKDTDPARLYVPPVLKGQVMRSIGLGEVIESKTDRFAKGDVVAGLLSWEEYSTVNVARVFNKVDPSLPLTMYLDLVGFVGFTAYFGLLEVGKVTKDSTVVISAAGGATGTKCIQIAKHLIGCKKVIGITGGAEKAKYVESLGADVCFDYRDANFEANLRKEIGTDFVDVYFDSVSGEILDIMLTLVKPAGTIVACGAIAGYNDREKLKIYNWGEIIKNRLTVKGFLVSEFRDKFMEAAPVLIGAVKQGKIKYSESDYTVVDATQDFSKIPEAWHLLFDEKKGPGKLLTKVAEYKA